MTIRTYRNDYVSVGQQSWIFDATFVPYGNDYRNFFFDLPEILNSTYSNRADSIFKDLGFGGGSSVMRGNTAISGKKYFELQATAGSGNTRFAIANSSETISTNFPGETTNVVCTAGSEGGNLNWRTNGVSSAGSPTIPYFEENDILQFAVDGDTGEIWMGKNNVWLNSGNPAAGTGEVATISGTLHPYIYVNAGSGGWIIQTELRYRPPSGFTPL
jgi:hypothetical protein